MLIKPQFPLLNVEYSASDLYSLDLSVDNKELESVEDQEGLGAYIEEKVRQAGRKYAIGGYGENRQVYRRFKHFDSEDSKRSIHLGIDFWAPAGLEIYNPLPAKVHSWAFNDNPGDYGGTLILKHPEQNLYSLYGHLALAELENLTPGKSIAPGALIARLGDYPENGGWPPHLHFQLIKDLEGRVGDYPGVVESHQAKAYLQNCPNPSAFF